MINHGRVGLDPGLGSHVGRLLFLFDFQDEVIELRRLDGNVLQEFGDLGGTFFQGNRGQHVDLGVREGAGNLALVQPVRVDRRADEFPATVGLVQRVAFLVVLGITVESRLFQATQVEGGKNPVRGVGVEDYASLGLVGRRQFGIGHRGLGGDRLEFIGELVILGLDLADVGRLPARRPDQQLRLATAQRFEELGHFRFLQVVHRLDPVLVLHIAGNIEALLTHVGLLVWHQ
ncbi:hypothetical protein D3C73_929460 [compost metagenome]